MILNNGFTNNICDKSDNNYDNDFGNNFDNDIGDNNLCNIFGNAVWYKMSVIIL
jgi:hypothetical protein